jgi:hypothetical protein
LFIRLSDQAEILPKAFKDLSLRQQALKIAQVGGERSK